jgi:hypothetical protein
LIALASNVTSKPKTCSVCKNKYLPTSNRQKYCPDCKKEIQKQWDKDKYKRRYVKKGYNQKGKNNNNWTGGTAPYYKRIAYEAYGKVCNRCGSENEIVVHHKDRNRKNNDITNLEVLCKKCHQHEHECWNNLGDYLGNKDMLRDELGRFKRHL